MRIAVYSGSFNPLHEGHVAILRRLSGMFDFTYLIVSPQNPFKGSEYLLSARDRFNAADGMLHRHPELSARADDIEFSMPAPQYSIRTLDALRDREPAIRSPWLLALTICPGSTNGRITAVSLWNTASSFFRGTE